MFAPDLVVRSRRVVSEHGVRAAAIHIRHEKIVGVLDYDNVPADCPVDDVGDAAVLPGVIDIQTHAKADEVMTRAAAAGGVTTIVDAGACVARIVHAMLPAPETVWSWWPRSYAAFLDAHPKSIENDAVAAVLEACRQSRTPTHIVCLSSSDVLAPLFHARAAQVPVSASTCPHYLYLAAEELTGSSRRYRCAPPIRGRENRELLWAAVAGGLVEAITSGGPTPADLSLPVTWTVMHGRGGTLERLARAMCRVPAQLAGLTRKGRIDVGYDADLAVFHPDEEFVADAPRHRTDPEALSYAGRRLRGVVDRTYVRGVPICLRKRR